MTKSPRVKTILILVLMLALFGVGYYAGQLLTRDDNQDTTSNNANSSDNGDSPGGVANVDPPRQVTDFSMMEDSGSPMSLSDLQGKVVILFFGYTNCPDVCPTTLSDLTVVKEALGEASDEVEFVFISVDYERDNPVKVAQFLSFFDEEFIGLIGDQETFSAIGQEYGLVIERENITVQTDDADVAESSEEAYFVQHTSPTFLIDRDGYLKHVYFYGTDLDLITASIQEVIKAQS